MVATAVAPALAPAITQTPPGVGYERLKERCMEVEEGIVRLLQPYQHSRDTWHAVNGKLSEAKEAMKALETELANHSLTQAFPSPTGGGGAVGTHAACDEDMLEVDSDTANRSACSQDAGEVDLVAQAVVDAKRAADGFDVHSTLPHVGGGGAGGGGYHRRGVATAAAAATVLPFAEMKHTFNDEFGGLILGVEELVRDTRARTRCHGTDESDVRPSAVLTDCLERGVKDLKECRKIVTTVQGTPALQSELSRFTKPCREFVDSLKELADTDTLQNKALFAHLDEAVRRTEFDAAQMKEKVQLDTQEGLVADLESQYRAMLTTQEATCKQLTEKLAAVQTLEDDIAAMKTRVTSTMTAFRAEYDGLGDTIVSWSHRCNNDLQNLCTARSVREASYSATLYRLKEDAEKSDERLQDNAKRQIEAWARLAGCERDLTRLAKERYLEVQHKIVSLNEVRKERAKHQAFLEWTRRREERLNETVRNCERLQDITRYLKTFITNRVESVSSYFGMLQCKADILKDESHRKYLDVFRGMYLDQGDLRAKKQQVLLRITDELDKEAMRLALCQESLDPNAKHHAGRVKQLTTVRDGVEEDVRTIDARTSLYLEWFKPTEAALMITDKDASHPVAALRLKENLRHQKLIAYRQLMSADASSEAAEPDAMVMLPRPPADRLPTSPPQRGRAAAQSL